MEARERVHVAVLGFEHDRIVEPAKRLKADKMVLLNWGGGEQPAFFQEVKEDLTEEGITTEERTCDIYDMYDVVRVTTSVVRRHPEDDVNVNISTGTKISAIGGMIACMVTEATPYYVKPDSYGDVDAAEPQPVSEGVDWIDGLPAYPIDGPEAQHVYILEYLFRHGPASKRELIEFSRGEGKELKTGNPDGKLPFLADSEGDSRKSWYRLLDNRILDPLQEKGLIQLEEVGRRIDVDLTQDGKNTVTAFQHIIEESEK